MSENEPSITVKLGTIYETVLRLDKAVTDMASDKAVVDKMTDEVNKLKTQVFGQWIVIGLFLTVVTTYYIGGING